MEKKWRKVQRGAIDIKKAVGKSYVGFFLSTREINTKMGKNVIYQFTDEDGNNFEIYGFTNLNREMENVKPNTECRITYRGTERVQTKYGLKDVHQVDVEVPDIEPDIPENETGIEPF